MKDHDSLDNLIINENIGSNKNNNIKNILTMIVLVLLVLIGAILLTKMILEEPQKSKISVEENLTNPALIQIDKYESNLNDINDSSIESINDTSSISNEINATDKDLVAKENISNEIASNTAVPTALAVKKVIVEQAHKESTRKPLLANNKVKTTAVTQAETKPAKKDLNKTEVVQTPTSETKPLIKNENSKQEQKTNNETYYVQVGAFSNKPNDEFISIIKKNGYNYKIVTNQNGLSKILIGPYKGKEESNRALAKIRDRINKSAFLVKQ